VLISKFTEIPVEEEESGDEGQIINKSKKNVSRSQYSRSARG